MSSIVRGGNLDEQVTGQLPARASGPLNRPLIRRREVAGAAPLSFAQERLWFLEQINPGDVSSNISGGVRLRSALNLDALGLAFQMMVARHETLRTTFARTELRAGVDSQPRQLVAQTGSVELPLVDLSNLSGDERERRARDLARVEAQRPFDLTLGPLWRTTLLRLDNCEHVLLLNAHRIICDDRSIEIFLRTLWECYRAAASSERSGLAALPVQYVDYAIWERESLEGEGIKEQIEFWKSKLAGAPSAIELPTDRPRPPLQTWHGASVCTVLQNGLMDQLRALANCANVTLFVTLLAAFQVLLARYSQHTDIVVGSRVENRDLEEKQGLIGPFSNSLALRTNLSGNPTFNGLLQRVRLVASEAYAHQATPFERLVEELQLQRSLSYAPIFQVALNLSETRVCKTEPGGLIVEEFEFESGIAKLDLTLDMQERQDQVHCRFEYNSDLFEGEMIERLANHFEVLLEGIVAQPDCRIAQLPLLTAGERERIVVEWNETKKDYPQGECVHDLFEVQVEKTPAATAVVCGGERLSYRELNERANQLAHYLQKLGVDPEQRIALCLPRSIRMLVAVLGTLKAGGAYVPLDPAYPRERVAFMLRDAGAAVLLTEKGLLGVLPETETKVVCLDSEWEKITEEDVSNPDNTAAAENLAYVIYTSGSTGEPKGVAIEHRSTVTFLRWANETFSPGELKGVLGSTSLCFDLSIFELFAPLSCGGKVILVENALHMPEVQEDVTLVNTVPSAMTELVRTDNLPVTVRTVNLAGEPLRKDLVQEIYKLETVKRVFNLYGPSEDTTYSTFARIEKDEMEEPTIGRPVANTMVYLLDANLEPVPVGVPGELYLSGAGIARGYLERAGSTAERFLPNPFSHEPGVRMYWTGDMARYREDGSIEFLGRMDHQVKLRGFRIELGEIEAVLSQHPGVRQAVVIVREVQKQNKRLVAYFVPASPSVPGTSDLRNYLQQSLPEYMVPSAFVPLDTIPLTPNGKVDRRALSPPDESRPDLKQPYMAPRDNVEGQLAKLWEKVLGLKSIGVEDNFFELGGDSLLAVRLFARIENTFGRNLPLATLFQAPTIEQLAGLLRETESQKAWSSLVTIQPHGSRPPLFCVHAGGANVLIYRPLSRHLGGEQPVYALQAQGLDGQAKPYLRIEDMAAHYIKEMRSVQPQGPYYLMGASFGGLIIFEMAHQLLAQGEKVSLLAMLNTNCPVYSLLHRMRCHAGHLVQYGPKVHTQNLIGAVSRRLRKSAAPTNSIDLSNRELQQALESLPDSDDPLVEVTLAIVQAEKDYILSNKIYPGKITLFWANDAERDFEDNRLGWKRLAAGGLDVHVVPGDHTSIREEPNVAVLVEKLKTCLERARLANVNGGTMAFSMETSK